VILSIVERFRIPSLTMVISLTCLLQPTLCVLVLDKALVEQVHRVLEPLVPDVVAFYYLMICGLYQVVYGVLTYTVDTLCSDS